MSTMNGKVALVTGAAGGIGSAPAKAFAARGATVACLDIDEAGATAVAEEITAAGGTAGFVRCDVADETSVTAAVDTVVRQFGRLDYAHNNAAVEGEVTPMANVARPDWDRVISINLTGVWLCMRAEIPHLLATGGAIVNTSSASGLVTRPGGLSTYIASKHGVVGLSKAAAVDYATAGIRINAVCPGPIRTPFTDSLSQEVTDMLLALTPVRRFAEPEEVAAAVVWLCSDEASYITGTAMPVDGGVVAF